MAQLVLHRGRAKPVWYGHPWIYAGAVARLEGDAEPGDLVEVSDCEGRGLGRGFWNPRSQIACRMLTRRPDEALGPDWLGERIGQALALRRRLGLPSALTTAYRLLNAEGDGLPGLVVDVYGDVAAVQFTALGIQRRAEAVFDALQAVLAPRGIVEVGGQAFAEAEGFAVGVGPVRGEVPPLLACREDGLDLEVDPGSGQKTGLYLDQRDNRRRFGALAAGARVLDLYCYAGGFGLAAARAGAAAVTAVDASGRALEQARRAAERNGLAVDLVEADAFRFLEAATPGSFDLACLDPPKFARARKDVEAALKGYRRLVALALAAVASGGLLLACNCSQLIDAAALERAVAGAALDARRSVRLLEVTSQAPDHVVPPAFPEGRYLTCLLLAVG